MKSNLQKITTIFALIILLGITIWAVHLPPGWRVIASYGTSLTGRTDAQRHNLELAVHSIDGKVIPAGQEFSFNRTVGSWTAERGYVKAPVSFDGELLPAWGGGVCQASSTLYNAALLAGMVIVERHHHRFPAKYVPPGQDAAVAQYDIDLRFINPYPWPVRISAGTDGEKVFCRLLAQHPLKNKITLEREITQITAPGEVTQVTSNQKENRVRLINPGQPGLQVMIYRRITDGFHSSRSLVSENNYPPMNRLIRIQ